MSFLQQQSPPSITKRKMTTILGAYVFKLFILNNPRHNMD